MLISPPGEIHKNWVLFPEKINGKYAILHSLSPEILIDYFDSLDDVNRDAYIKSHYARIPKKRSWEDYIRGAGPPPLKTSYGWLLLYHAMEKAEPHRYKLGAMILDAGDPTKILHRSPEPILEPDGMYENEGHKSGIIYSCGAVVIDGTLYVYYGGADTVVCVATAKLDTFLKALAAGKKPKLKKIQKKRRQKL